MLPPALPLRIQEEQEHEKDNGIRPPPHKPPGDTPIKTVPSGTPGKVKNAGFKPIGQQSSAVKRFFPGSDEDDEDNYDYGHGYDEEEAFYDEEERRELNEFGVTNADVEEMWEYGIKPWEDDAYVRAFALFWGLLSQC